jgi:hypothetical protein
MTRFAAFTDDELDVLTRAFTAGHEEGALADHGPSLDLTAELRAEAMSRGRDIEEPYGRGKTRVEYWKPEMI